MADSRVTVSWIHPPLHDLAPNFADGTGLRRVVVKVDCDFTGDQTALTDETIVDISELRTVSGGECKRTKVEWVQFGSMAADTVAHLEWDRVPQVPICSSGAGQGGSKLHLDALDPSDGNGGDGTGDIVLSVAGADAEDRFTILLSVRLKDARS